LVIDVALSMGDVNKDAKGKPEGKIHITI